MRGNTGGFEMRTKIQLGERKLKWWKEKKSSSGQNVDVHFHVHIWEYVFIMFTKILVNLLIRLFLNVVRGERLLIIVSFNIAN